VPLLMLGAVSPVLIAHLDRRRPGAGSAAGRLFFTNTMGGLAGGWITAFALIPHASLRASLVATGVGLIALALAWAVIARSVALPAVAALLVAGGYALLVPRPPQVFKDKQGNPIEVRYSRQSGIGLLQVLDYHYPSRDTRQLLINGVLQGEADPSTGQALEDYIQNLHLLSHAHHPRARSALQLGLGAGLLPHELARDGVRVTAVEIEPQVVALARRYFHLPPAVDVRLGDARSVLRRDRTSYDLIVLDAFASESTAWHLLTSEALTEMRRRLNPGGRLLINTVAFADPDRATGLARIEATVLKVFPQAIVYPEKPLGDDPEELINATIVAGQDLRPVALAPSPAFSPDALRDLLALGRPARSRGPVSTDDRSDLDYTEAALRVRWRTLIWESLGSDLLAD
jgi:predicted membrane-bound spermidine synthase